MIMADVFKILFLILGMLICTVSYWLLFTALFPRIVERTQRALVSHPYRTFMTGALAGVPLTLIGLAMAGQGAGPLKLVGVILLMALTLAALFGSTGLARQVGLGLDDGQSLRRNGATVLRGGSVVSIACVFPVVGWFFVIPVVLIAGFGAALHLAVSRRAVSAPAGTAAGVVQA